MSNQYPTPKVTAGALAAAVMTFVTWIVTTYTSLEIPPEIWTALTGLVSAVAAWITPG